jgi:hypothetical protein
MNAMAKQMKTTGMTGGSEGSRIEELTAELGEEEQKQIIEVMQSLSPEEMMRFEGLNDQESFFEVTKIIEDRKQKKEKEWREIQERKAKESEIARMEQVAGVMQTLSPEELVKFENLSQEESVIEIDKIIKKRVRKQK